LKNKDLGEAVYIPSIMLKLNTDLFLDDKNIKEVENLSLHDQINLKILQLSNFKDPDEYLNSHTPEDYFNLIDNSSFWIDWEIDQIFKIKI